MVTAHTGNHPELLELGIKTLAHWVEIDGNPVRMPQGGIDTYPNAEAAQFAARCTQRRLDKEN